MAACRSEVSAHRNSVGFSLCEALITALIVIIAAAGLLQFTGQVLFCYERNQMASRETLDVWNRSRGLRRNRPDSTNVVVPVPGARPLRRFVLTRQSGRPWEVLCAQK